MVTCPEVFRSQYRAHSPIFFPSTAMPWNKLDGQIFHKSTLKNFQAKLDFRAVLDFLTNFLTASSTNLVYFRVHRIANCYTKYLKVFLLSIFIPKVSKKAKNKSMLVVILVFFNFILKNTVKQNMFCTKGGKIVFT